MEQPRSAESLYEIDFAEWIEQQVGSLRARRFDELDLLNLIEELEGLAGNLKRELRSRIRSIEMHLLKLRYQPERRSRSWLSTIVEQRSEIEDLLKASPSLRRLVPNYVTDVYPGARKRAAIETKIPEKQFPAENPFSVDDVFTDESDFKSSED